jgi:hypothetical protein
MERSEPRGCPVDGKAPIGTCTPGPVAASTTPSPVDGSAQGIVSRLRRGSDRDLGWRMTRRRSSRLRRRVRAPGYGTIRAWWFLVVPRVSTDRQSLDQQHDALTVASEGFPPTSVPVPVTTVRACRAARLRPRRRRRGGARSARAQYVRIIRTIETLTAAGVQLRSLRESIDTTTAATPNQRAILTALTCPNHPSSTTSGSEW